MPKPIDSCKEKMERKTGAGQRIIRPNHAAAVPHTCDARDGTARILSPESPPLFDCPKFGSHVIDYATVTTCVP